MSEPAQINRQKRRNRLASDILELVRSRLVVRMPFFNRAILKMPVDIYEHYEIGEEEIREYGTDGNNIYCHVGRVLQDFRIEENRVFRVYMHLILHCVFNHPFSYTQMETRLWDISCDMAVEYTILELKHDELSLNGDRAERTKLEAFAKKAGRMTAENIYHFLRLHRDEAEELLKDSELFYRDCHAFWIPEDEKSAVRRFPKNPHPGIGKISQEWKKLGVSVRLDVQVFEENQGQLAGSLMENLNSLRREKTDYTEFLKKFAVMHEEVRINHEEFDYIYYTYGMELYGDMPLIEPLEYRETRKIRDFVIAIDTSGSCQGKTVESFLRKTYSILKTSGSFFDEINVHIIQCDSQIQMDVCVSSEQEFETYMKTMKIAGFGGTDFRPVFQYVDRMIENRELTDLKGLIYFTDGRGTFPERMPAYKTAFVFVDDGYSTPGFPPWAMKTILHEEELQEQCGQNVGS